MRNHEIVKTALQFPHRGAEWLSGKLKGKGIMTSSGTIHAILKNNNLAKKQERLTHLLNEYKKEPRNFSSNSIRGMKLLSPHFNYRSYSTQEPGEYLFVWREKGFVSNSRIRVPFYIFLDACGFFIYVYPETSCYPTIYDSHASGSLQNPFAKPINWAMKKFYNFFDLQIKMICVQGSDENKQGVQILRDHLNDKKIEMRVLSEYGFNKIPFIKDFKQSFKREFLRKKLKSIQHRRRNEETITSITNLTSEYINQYNNAAISTWPNLGRTPYQYATDYAGVELYLPSRQEWLKKIQTSERNQENKLNNEPVIN